MTRPKNDWTLGDAKDWLNDRLPEGVTCPCCTQHAKIYMRPLHSGMAHALVHMYKNRDDTNRFDITTHLYTNKGDTSKLRHWGLTVHHKDEKPGVYQITPLGIRFVRGLESVQSHAEIYDGRFLGLSGEYITIREALGKKFDYDALMRTPGTADPGL